MQPATLPPAALALLVRELLSVTYASTPSRRAHEGGPVRLHDGQGRVSAPLRAARGAAIVLRAAGGARRPEVARGDAAKLRVHSQSVAAHHSREQEPHLPATQ